MKKPTKPRRKGRGAGGDKPLASAFHSSLLRRLDNLGRSATLIAHNLFIIAQANRPTEQFPHRAAHQGTPRHPKGDAQIPLPLSAISDNSDVYEHAAADGREPDGIDSERNTTCDDHFPDLDAGLAAHLFGDAEK